MKISYNIKHHILEKKKLTDNSLTTTINLTVMCFNILVHFLTFEHHELLI